MANSVQPRFGFPGLRVSYTCTAAVLGGRLVELTGSRTVGPAGAGSTKVVGVAQFDVPASRATIQGPQVGDGDELTVLNDCVVGLVASGAITAGDKVVAAAAGKVAAIGALDPTNAASVDTDVANTRAIVGTALETVADAAIVLVRVNV